MNRIINFIKGILKLAFSGATAFFAVIGAAEYLGEKGVPETDANIFLGIIYGVAVLLLVYIGLEYYKEAAHKNGKKK